VSEQKQNNSEQTGEASDTVASVSEEPAGKGTPAASQSKSGTAPRKASSAIAWLALLLVIGLAVGAAGVIRQGQDMQVALDRRVVELEAISRQKEANLDELNDRWQRELRSGLDDAKASFGDEASQLSKRLESVEAILAEQQKELARFSASDRNSWLLAEAGHLLRLANQRLVMAGDPVAAQALLNSVDAVLREIDDPSLHAVRGAVAADIASLRAVPRVDVEGIYLRLAALIEQADKLVIFQLPEPAARTTPEAAKDWRDRLQQGYEAALAKLADYIIIRRRDVPMQALMDPQWEGLVRQNMRMLLEQAQVALLSGNQVLYDASLERAQHWVAQFLQSDEVAARAISVEITQLAGLTIGVPQPDISRSLQALDVAIAQRLQAEGGQ
jgi:uroporphyrin-3 C-methyltransferase